MLISPHRVIAIGLGAALLACAGCRNYGPSLQVVIDAEGPLDKRVEAAEGTLYEVGMRRKADDTGFTIQAYLPGRSGVVELKNVSAFELREDSDVQAFLRRTPDSAVLHLQMEDYGKEGWEWRPRVRAVALKILDELKQRFGAEHLSIESPPLCDLTGDGTCERRK
jgi:hypothetical protein